MTGVPITVRANEDREGLGPLVDHSRGAGDCRVRGTVNPPTLKVAEALAAAVARGRRADEQGRDWHR